MRTVLMLIAALAALKIWTQDRLYRTVMDDAVVQAYRDRAVQLCQKESQKAGKATSPALWSTNAGTEIVIGSRTANVALWDLDNPLWDVRFRHPHLVLTASGAGKGHCSIDLIAGLASVSDH